MAYTATVTLDSPVSIPLATSGFRVLSGSCNITDYNATLVEITGITKKFRNTPVVVANLSDEGYAPFWDGTAGAFKAFGAQVTPATGVVTDNNDAATLGHKLYAVPMFEAPRAQVLVAESSATGLITDNDDAATAGVLIYVVVDDANFMPGYQLGHFEFVSPTNANGTCTIASAKETLTLFDADAAATNGVAVRATAASGGLEATTAAEVDILVPLSSGKYIHVNHATTGSTPSVYFDEDAGNTYERLQAVVVDNNDEPYKLFVSSLAATEDVPGYVSPQGIQMAQIVTVGPKPFTYLVGASGPEVYVVSRPDAASLPGSAPLFAQAAGAGLNAKVPGGKTVFVPTSTGQFVPIAFGQDGVQVYGYPEGATGDLRWLGVIVDNADETFVTSSAVGFAQSVPLSNNEPANGTDVGAFDFIAFGR